MECLLIDRSRRGGHRQARLQEVRRSILALAGTALARGSAGRYSGRMTTAVALLVATAASLGLLSILAGLLLRPARTK
jgi:hypothetical protein